MMGALRAVVRGLESLAQTYREDMSTVVKLTIMKDEIADFEEATRMLLSTPCAELRVREDSTFRPADPS